MRASSAAAAGPSSDLALDVEDRRQARPGAARLVDRLEDLRDALPLLGHRDQLLEQPARALVVRRGLDDLSPAGRARPATSPRWLARSSARRNSSSGDLGVRGEADARAEQVLEIAPALARRVVAIERPVRAQIGRVQLQHLLVGGERVVLVVERRLVEIGDLRQQLQPLADVQLRELARVEQRAQLRPALAVAVQARQRAERARVQRLGLEDLRVDLLRVLRPPEPLLLQLRDEHQQIAPQDLILGLGRHRAQLLGQLAGLARRLGEAEQRVAVLRVRGIDVEQRQADAVRARRVVRPARRRAPRSFSSRSTFSPRVSAIGEQRLVGRRQLGASPVRS